MCRGEGGEGFRVSGGVWNPGFKFRVQTAGFEVESLLKL